ncbi:MAG TPA: pyridoxamine 5'-phosphate oxidase [Haliangiales bacterium]|nr:pyridoxamine 5'-phosphate oxidase [Haliangiales bacterium]
MSIADLRKEYTLGSLKEADLDADPLRQFDQWFQQAAQVKAGGGRWRAFAIGLYNAFQALLGHKPVDPNAMALATADKEGCPSARMVLLKGADERGFIFFTNYESRKGSELAENPHAALVFYWPELERQVCVVGTVTKLPREESQAYFKSRPRGARLAAWASDQHSVAPSREALQQRLIEFEAKFRDEDVPLPPYWGGFVLAPREIQFWQGRPNRLHDRFRYTKRTDGKWLIERLAP